MGVSGLITTLSLYQIFARSRFCKQSEESLVTYNCIADWLIESVEISELRRDPTRGSLLGRLLDRLLLRRCTSLHIGLLGLRLVHGLGGKASFVVSQVDVSMQV